MADSGTQLPSPAPDSTSSASDFNLPSLLVNSFNETQQQFKNIAASGGGGGGQGLATATAGTQQTAQAEADIATLQGAAAAKLQADNQAAAARYGMLPGAGSLNVVAISEHLKNLEERILGEQEDLRGTLNQSFLDNPVQWIVNQFKIPHMARIQMQDEATYQQQSDVLTSMAAHTEEAFKVNAGVDTANATAMAVALSSKAFGQAKERLAQDQFEAAKIGIEATNVRLAATRDQFEASVQFNNAINQKTDIGIKQQQLQISQQEFELQGRRFTADQEQRAKELDISYKRLDQENTKIGIEQQQLAINDNRLQIEKDQNARQAALAPFQLLLEQTQSADAVIRAQSKADLQQKLNAALVMSNMNPMTVDQYIALPDTKRKQFLADQMMDPNLQGGQYGFNATDAVRRVNSYEIPLPSGVDYVRNKLTDYMQNAITQVGPQLFKTLPLEDQNAKIQGSIQASLAREMNNIPDTGGMFSPPPLLSTVKIPAVFSTDIGKALLPLANGNPQYATKSQDIYAMAATMIHEGKLTVGQAADQISQIYTAIATDVSNQRQYQRFQVVGPSKESGFKQTVLTGGFSSSTTVDNTNAGAVATTLQRMLYNQGAGAELQQQEIQSGMRP
jgi:hypothetical protein